MKIHRYTHFERVEPILIKILESFLECMAQSSVWLKMHHLPGLQQKTTFLLLW